MLKNLPPTLRELLLHRRQPDESVVPCLFVIDTATNVIISETCGASMVADAEKNMASWIPSRPEMRSMVPTPDAKVKMLLHTILMSELPCPVPRCDIWRAQLQAELGRLPEDCAVCDRNQIINRAVQAYAPELVAYMLEHPEFTGLQASPDEPSSQA